MPVELKSSGNHRQNQSLFFLTENYLQKECCAFILIFNAIGLRVANDLSLAWDHGRRIDVQAWNSAKSSQKPS